MLKKTKGIKVDGENRRNKPWFLISNEYRDLSLDSNFYIGRDNNAPVVRSGIYKMPYKFTGTIIKVAIHYTGNDNKWMNVEI